jgi:hypothetical protein
LSKPPQPEAKPIEPSPFQPANPPLLSEATAMANTDQDLDSIWSELLDELQRRHLPTFSLVSTHAFPISLGADELTIGVLVENFQKMIENKIDHLRAASQAVSGRSLKVKVRTVDQPTPKTKGKDKAGQGKSSTIVARVDEPEQESPEVRDAQVQNQLALADQEEPAIKTSESTTLPTAKRVQPGNGQGISHLIQDAYRLFEGPGSRLISASQ